MLSCVYGSLRLRILVSGYVYDLLQTHVVLGYMCLLTEGVCVCLQRVCVFVCVYVCVCMFVVCVCVCV